MPKHVPCFDVPKCVFGTISIVTKETRVVPFGRGVLHMYTSRGCIVVLHLHAGKYCLFTKTPTDGVRVSELGGYSTMGAGSIVRSSLRDSYSLDLNF
jgi:hypothetical protein